MRVDLLGAVEVWVDTGQVRLPKGRVQVVLATLALAGGRPVGVNELIDRTWGEQLPANPAGSLVTLIYRLRDLVGRDMVASTPGGYRLQVEPERVDVLRFRQLIDDATQLDDDAKSRALLDEAIGLWRGEPLGGIAAFQADEIPHITEEYLVARERRIALDLSAGRYEPAIVALYDLTARYPIRETLWHQLIGALAGAGRQAEALSAYETIRSRLADELGVDPSAGLRDLYGQLLRGDLLAGPAPQPAMFAEGVDDGAAGPAPHSLPRDITDFTGRSGELAAVEAAGRMAADTVITVAIDGMGGAGKTMLAVRAAHRLTPDFPDGQLFLDLRGHSPGEQPMSAMEALGNLLRAIGVAAGGVPEPFDDRIGLWRSRVAGRRLLLVLDNAASADQIRALLPGTAGSVVLVTSRRRLVDLDTTATVSIGELGDQPAGELFAAVVGPERAAAEPDAVAEVLALCGYLPLAIRISAARLRSRPAWQIGHLVGRLRSAHGRLAELSAGNRDVAATLAVSYHHLSSSGRRMFRLLGLVPGSTIDTYAAGALAGNTVDQTEPLLADLVDAHLLAEIAPGRFQLHDLLREQAQRMAAADEPAALRQEAELRLLDYYLALSGRSQAMFLGTPMRPHIASKIAAAQLPAAEDYQAMLGLMQAERTNLLAAVDLAANAGHDEYAIWLPYVLGYFLDLSGSSADAERVHQIALAATRRTGDIEIRANLLSNLSAIVHSVGRFEAALDHADRAERLFRELGNDRAVGRSLNNGGNALYRMGRYREALDRYRRALALFPNDRDDTAISLLINLAIVELRFDRVPAARDYADRALAASDQPDHRNRAGALAIFGNIKRREGDYAAAEQAYAEAVRSSLARGDVSMRASITNERGILERLHGRYALAVGEHISALRLNRRIGDVSAEAESGNDLGITLRIAGHPRLAAAIHRAALGPAINASNRYEAARAHEGIAAAIAATEPASALTHAEQARVILGELGVPDAARVQNLIATLSAAGAE